MKTPRKQKVNYVDKKELYDAMKEYHRRCAPFKAVWEEQFADVPKKKRPLCNYPPIPRFIAESIVKIANKLANSPNFMSYSYRDDMIADGIFDCIKHIHSFNPEKSDNAFGYFTTCCWYASVRRIKSEKKERQGKTEMVRNSGILHDLISETHEFDDGSYESSYLNFLKEQIDVVQSDAERENEAKMFPKKTTKAYQKRLKELEEIARSKEATIYDQSVLDDAEEEEQNDLILSSPEDQTQIFDFISPDQED